MNHLAINAILNPRVKAVIERLYAETLKTDPIVRRAAKELGLRSDSDDGFYKAMSHAYMPITPDLGSLLYLLVRALNAHSVVEYGTSFGISTIFLAEALRDNGGGRLVTTEIEAEKAERAYHNLVEAGLEDLVEIRIGDAKQTLTDDLPERVDFLLLDGKKVDYLPILKTLEPVMSTGAIVSADNSEMSGFQSFLKYVSNPSNGYVTSTLFTKALGSLHGNQIVMKR